MKKIFVALSAILVWTAIPAVAANAVSIGQACAKTTLGTRVSIRVNSKPVIVVCRTVAGRKKWIRAAVQTLVTTTTSTTSTIAPQPVINFTDVVDPIDPTMHTITVEGMQPRTYLLKVPTNYVAGTSVPLLLALHSRSTNAKTIFEDSQILSLAEEKNFIVAGVNGSLHEDYTSWNAGSCCTNATTFQENDLLLLSTIIDYLETQYSVDKSRVWAMGHSNGGMMAYRIACDLSEKITAIAVVAGALVDDTCSPTKPVPIIHIHGNLDTTVPFHGGGKLETPNIYFSAVDFAKSNSCTSAPAEAVGPIKEKYLWNCKNGFESVLVNYQEQSHGWAPGYTDEIVAFLFAHPRK